MILSPHGCEQGKHSDTGLPHASFSGPGLGQHPSPRHPPAGRAGRLTMGSGKGGEWARVAPKNDSKKKKDQSEQAGLALTTALPAQARHLLTGEAPACVTSITEEAGERLLPSL